MKFLIAVALFCFTLGSHAFPTQECSNSDMEATPIAFFALNGDSGIRLSFWKHDSNAWVVKCIANESNTTNPTVCHILTSENSGYDVTFFKDGPHFKASVTPWNEQGNQARYNLSCTNMNR
jgi:hypothetical protein